MWSMPMSFVRAFLAISVAVSLTGFANAQEEQARQVEVGSREVKINVPTNGCTDKSNFAPELDADGKVKLVQVRPDSCKGWFPEGEWLKYTWGELGLSKPEFRGAYIAKDRRG